MRSTGDTAYRVLSELEAKPTACLVCQVIEIDSSNNSPGCVEAWKGGDDRAIVAIKTYRVCLKKRRESCIEVTVDHGVRWPNGGDQG